MAPWTRKNDYVDLSEKIRKKQQQRDSFSQPEIETPSQTTNSSSSSGFFNMFGNNSTPSPTPETSTESAEEKRRKLAKRLMDMTSKIEGLENEIYQLKQRLELMERKQRVGY